MKASSSDASYDEDAEDFVLDFEDFFSVLMYYGHMSKEEILHSSRPFLYAVYKMYGKRACENLGVSPDSKKEDKDTPLTEKDYPVEFKKLTKKERKKAAEQYADERDFLSGFSQFNQDKYTNLTITD